MNSGKSLSGSFEELILKAFYVALGQFESQISSDMAQEIQAVALGADSDIKQINKLEDIAKKEPEFEKLYEDAYEKLLVLDESGEKGKYYAKVRAEGGKPKTIKGMIENLSAPNPQDGAKEDARESKDDLLGRVFRWK